MKILTGGLHGSKFQNYLTEHYPEIQCVLSSSTEESLMLLTEVDCLAGFNFLPKSDLSHIKWIHSFGAGVDAFLKHQFSDQLIMTKTTGKMAQRIGEYCLTYSLHCIKEVALYKQQQEEQNWTQFYPKALNDYAVIIFGTGFVGQGIAQVLNSHFKTIIGINNSGHQVKGFTSTMTIRQFYDMDVAADTILINALPLTQNTQKLFNKSIFEKLDQSVFINIGRGASADENDILIALKNQKLSKAVLDVFEKEPLPQEHPFWKHSDVIVTPHISGITTFSDITSNFETAYEAIKKGDAIPFQVNLQKGY